MSRILKVIISVVVVAVVLTATLVTGVVIGRSGLFGGALWTPAPAVPADQPDEFSIFWQAWNIVEANFVDRAALDEQEMTYGAIRGMVRALGDEGHTAFLTPEEREQQQTDLSGTFSGIGAQLGVRDSLPVIIAPFDGSPADLAGVRAGDVIISVDGEDVTTLPLTDIVTLIRGPEGSDVTLTLLRPDENRSLEVTITRGEIKVPAATWAMVPSTDIALIRLSQFSANAEADVVAAVEGANEAGATQLIVDVRNNPGGLLEQAINVTSHFLDEGNVLLEEDAEGNRREYAVVEGGVATETPLIALINPGSASSSEIFAGAIQDHERGILIGETTFGTGTVLQPFPLDDGSALLLGTRQWLTPEGRLIRKLGIDPDIEVPLPIGADLIVPAELDGMSLAEVLTSEDLQLRRALEAFDVPGAAVE